MSFLCLYNNALMLPTGETYRPFYVNKPPIAGECVTDPLNGTALVTLFKVYCPVAFEDPHKPFIYEISSAGEPAKQNDPTRIKTWNFFHKGIANSQRTCSIVLWFNE